MKSSRKRKRKQHWIYSNISIGVLVLVALFLSYQLIGLIGKYNISETKRAEAQAEYQRYKNQEESLRARTEALDTPEGKERAIRERFNVVKEGEGVIYVIDGEDASVTSQEEANVEEEKTLIERVKSFFLWVDDGS